MIETEQGIERGWLFQEDLMHAVNALAEAVVGEDGIWRDGVPEGNIQRAHIALLGVVNKRVQRLEALCTHADTVLRKIRRDWILGEEELGLDVDAWRLSWDTARERPPKG